MRADTLKDWLETKGCRFEEQPHKRGIGPVGLVAKLNGRSTFLPISAGTHDLEEEDLERILFDLHLEDEILPGHREDQKEIYRHWQRGQGT